MSYPRTPTTTTSAATTTPNATPNEPYDASPGTPTVSATPSVSTPSKPHNSPNAASLTAIFDAGNVSSYAEVFDESTRGVAHRLLPGCDCRSRCSQPNRRSAMSEHTYRVTEIVGTSPESLERAVRNGIARAGQTLRNLEWFEVSEIRGQIADGAVAQFQVGLKVGFRF